MQYASFPWLFLIACATEPVDEPPVPDPATAGTEFMALPGGGYLQKSERGHRIVVQGKVRDPLRCVSLVSIGERTGDSLISVHCDLHILDFALVSVLRLKRHPMEASIVLDKSHVDVLVQWSTAEGSITTYRAEDLVKCSGPSARAPWILVGSWDQQADPDTGRVGRRLAAAKSGILMRPSWDRNAYMCTLDDSNEFKPNRRLLPPSGSSVWVILAAPNR